MSLKQTILEKYFGAQRELVEIEQIEASNVIISLPLHFSANNRVELAITQITPEYFNISDMAQTLGELKDAGIGINQKLRNKISEIGKAGKIEFVGNHLIRKCNVSELGHAIHEFADTAKTIGDAYLTYRSAKVKEEDDLVTKVREIFTSRHQDFKEQKEVRGEIETHKIDFYIPPNGSKGLAVAVLPNPTQIVAEAWGFKTQDIKHVNHSLSVSVVYDSLRAKEVSRKILERMADVPIPSNSIENLAAFLENMGSH